MQWAASASGPGEQGTRGWTDRGNAESFLTDEALGPMVTQVWRSFSGLTPAGHRLPSSVRPSQAPEYAGVSCHDWPLLSSIFISQQHKPISWPEAKSPLCCAVLSHSVVSNSLRPHGLEPARLLCPWGFSRQESWSELPCPPSGALPNPGIEPAPFTSPALAGGVSITWEAQTHT